MASLVDSNSKTPPPIPTNSSSNRIDLTTVSPAKAIFLWGTLGYLTPPQELAFAKFRSEARESDIEIAKYTVETFDQCCLRFLRARQFDAEKALILLTECNQKLFEMKADYWSMLTPDECANCDIAALKNFYPHAQAGFDKMNRPLLFEHTGGMNPSAILQISNRRNLINYHWWSMENSLDQKFTEAAKRNLAEKGDEPGEVLNNISTCVILDLRDLGLVHCSQKMMDQMKLYIGLDNTCYPETLGKMLVINAPFLAVQTWAMVRRSLDPRTQQKIEIVSPADTPAKLLEYVSVDNLPSMYGGTAPDIYHHKANTEAVQVPRGGKFLKVIDVPAGKGLSVDSYVNEGPLDISITTTSASVRSPKLLSPSVNVVPSEERDEGPARNLQVFPPTGEDRQVTVTWMNSARFSSKPLIYVLTVLNPAPN